MPDMTKVEVPRTGTYYTRASVLAVILGKEIQREFGARIDCAIGGTASKPYYAWKLPESVTISISRYLDADPRVAIRRNDPVKEPPNDSDWKHDTRGRDYETKAYDVAAIIGIGREFVFYNRSVRETHEANEAVRARELDGIGEIPHGMKLTRDPKTGLYDFWMYTDVKRLTAEEAKTALNAARSFRAACPEGGPEEAKED